MNHTNIEYKVMNYSKEKAQIASGHLVVVIVYAIKDN